MLRLVVDFYANQPLMIVLVAATWSVLGIPGVLRYRRVQRSPTGFIAVWLAVMPVIVVLVPLVVIWAACTTGTCS